MRAAFSMRRRACQLREALAGAVLNDADDLAAAVAELRGQRIQRDVCEDKRLCQRCA